MTTKAGPVHSTKQEHTCATQTPGQSDALNDGCRQQSISAGQTSKHMKDAKPQQSVEPMIPSESAKKRVTCGLQSKANKNTHAKFLSQRNFRSRGSIKNCSSHPSHATEESIHASSCAKFSFSRTKEEKARNFTSSKIVTKVLFKVQVPKGNLQRLKNPEEYTARVQTKTVISDKHCGRTHEGSRKIQRAERNVLPPDVLMCRITACKTMLFKLYK
jgi:hypothetical protein